MIAIELAAFSDSVEVIFTGLSIVALYSISFLELMKNGSNSASSHAMFPGLDFLLLHWHCSALG